MCHQSFQNGFDLYIYIKKNPTLSLSNQSTCPLHCLLQMKYFCPDSHASWKAKGIRVNQHRSCFSCQEEAKEECRIESSDFHKFSERNGKYILEGEETAFCCREAGVQLLASMLYWQCPCCSCGSGVGDMSS